MIKYYKKTRWKEIFRMGEFLNWRQYTFLSHLTTKSKISVWWIKNRSLIQCLFIIKCHKSKLYVCPYPRRRNVMRRYWRRLRIHTLWNLYHESKNKKRTGVYRFICYTNLRGIFDGKRLDEIFQEWDFLRQDIVVPIVTTYASRYVLCFQFHTK